MRLETIFWNGNGSVEENRLRSQLEEEGFSVFRWRDEAGVSYDPHSHAHDQSLWIIDGELVFGAAGHDVRLQSGDRLLLPKGTVHTAYAGTAGATYLIGERG